MSLTCGHTFAEAPLHPWCDGCCAVPLEMVRRAQDLERMTPGQRMRAAAYLFRWNQKDSR
jgi:hypothetical protein